MDRQQIDFDLLSQRRAEIGAERVTVWLWRRRNTRPRARFMPEIAKVLGWSLSDVVEALWEEKIGDPCPCGCGNEKDFSLKWPNARMLAIKIPCECGIPPRIRKRHPDGRYHLQLCPKCSRESRRIEIRFTCLGYDVCETHVPCQRTKLMGSRELGSKRYAKARNPNSAFDEDNQQWQCGSCSNLERLWKQRKEELFLHVQEKHPEIELRRVRTFEQLKKLQGEHTRCLRPMLIQKGTENLTAGPRRSGYSAPGVVKSLLLRHWGGPPEEWPKNERFGLCRLCGFLARRTEQPPRFHDRCYHKSQSPEVSVPPSKRGRPVTEGSLKSAWAWTIQYCLAEKAYDDIAKENGVHLTSVKERIEFLIGILDPEFLRQPYRRDAEVILDAYRKRRRRTVRLADDANNSAATGF